MIQAELKGKLPEVENKEDILTSNIFGLIKYLSPDKGIYKILGKTTNYENKNSIISDLRLKGIDINKYEHVKYFFWPNSSKYGEPDLILILESSQDGLDPLILLIEVKYFSEKSRTGEFDQLKDYFLSISDRKSRNTFGNTEISQFEGIFIGVIYLTLYPQHKEALSSALELKKEGVSNPESQIYELRWNNITKVLKNVDVQGVERKILKDAITLLEHKNLIDFEGFSGISLSLGNTPIFLQEKVLQEQGFRGFPIFAFDGELNTNVFFEGG